MRLVSRLAKGAWVLKPQSAKAKGRRFQQEVRDALLETFPQLKADDIRSTSMGSGGEDIQLSPAAREVIPFSIECKNVEAINIWRAIDQAGGRAHPPLVVFRRNKTRPHVTLPLDDFLSLLQDAAEGTRQIGALRG